MLRPDVSPIGSLGRGGNPCPPEPASIGLQAGLQANTHAPCSLAKCRSDFSPTTAPARYHCVGLKSGLRLVGLCLSSVLLAAPAHADDETPWTFNSRAQGLLSATHIERQDNSQLNPGNAIAHIPSERYDLELRPDLEWKRPGLSLALKPRFGLTHAPGSSDDDLWLNEGWLRWKPAQQWYLQAGREIWLWGPSMFWSPSNPFYLGTGKNLPQRELPGRDIARLSWMPADNAALTLAGQFGNGHQREYEPPSRKLALLKLDLNNNEASGSLIASRREGEVWRFGAYGQWTVSDALLLYGDGSYGQNASLTHVLPAANPLGWTVENNSQRSATVLIGGAYTFEGGINLNLEALHYGDGRDDAQAANVGEMAQQLQAALASPLAPYAAASLGASITPQRLQQRQNYLAVQLMDPTRERYSWTVRYSYNLDDHSSELVPLGTYDLNDRLQLWGNLSLRHGRNNAEYSQLIRYSAMLGLTWFAW